MLVAPDGRVLDPIDRVSEVLFGLFMVLTFTGTLSVATAGREDVRTMLIAAIGCNTAWGFVDGVMYVLRTLVTRSRGATLWQRAARHRQPRERAASHRRRTSGRWAPGSTRPRWSACIAGCSRSQCTPAHHCA